MSRKIMVGIVVSPDASGYFNNGLHQNAYYLHLLLKKIPVVNPILVYPSGVWSKITGDEAEVFGEKAYSLELFKEKYHLDVLLLVSVMLSKTYLQPFRDKGVKIADVIYGNRYVMDQETFVFGHLKHPEEGKTNHCVQGLLREDSICDAVWMSPHFAWQKDYMLHRYRADRAYQCPYIWSPKLMQMQILGDKYYEEDTPFFKNRDERNKKIFCTEPNLNVLKTSLFPYMAANILHERGQEDFEKIYLFNAIKNFQQNEKAADYIRHFPLAKDRKVSFEPRYSFPTIIKHARLMFHHHFMNGLNYTMLEAAYLKLPVVHNSEFMTDLGYYYRGANLTEAVHQLEHALNHEERDDLEEYNAACDRVVDKFSIDNMENIKGYQTLLCNLLDEKIDPELPVYMQNLENDLAHSEGYISPLSKY